MIKFECKKCNEGMEAPESLAGDKLQCPSCNIWVDIPNPITKERCQNALTKAWSKSPPAFRNAFVATFGVIAALTVAMYVYGHWFADKPQQTASPLLVPTMSQPAPQPTATAPSIPPAGSNTNATAIAAIDAKLAKIGLFPTEQQKDKILNGRKLNVKYYQGDANFATPYIAVWTDRNDVIQGFSAEWETWNIKGEKLIETIQKSSASYEYHFQAMLLFKAMFDDGDDFSFDKLNYQAHGLKKEKAEGPMREKGIYRIVREKVDFKEQGDFYTYFAMVTFW